MNKKVSKLRLYDEDIRKILYSVYEQEKFWFSLSEKNIDGDDKKLSVRQYWEYKVLRTALDQIFGDNHKFYLVAVHYES